MFLPPSCGAQGVSGYTITTMAGNGTRGYSGDGGPATSAQLSSPAGIFVDASGTLYIADQVNYRIRAVTAQGNISTVAGNGTAGYAGDGGKATSAELANPFAVAVDSSGNFYIADVTNAVIRKVTSAGTITTVAGNNTAGAGFGGDGGAGTSAQLNQPSGVAVDSSGNVFIADTVNNRIRKLTSGGTITTAAGTGVAGFSGDGLAGTKAMLNAPRGIAVDAFNNLYIADSGNQRIRKLASNGIITTVAGTGVAGFSGDGGFATSAQINRPFDVKVDSAGNLYIADYLNSRIRRVAANGGITTIAGNGRFAYTGDGGPATSATLNFPSGVAVDTSGNVYVADNQNSVIRLLTPPASLATPPSINTGGVITASQFGAFPATAPGSWIEIYGSGLAAGAGSWANSFTGVNAPTLLDGTTVTIGGQAAFLSYVSDGQVNAQVPSNVGLGPQSLFVNSPTGSSAPYTITVNATEPGMVAPPSFNIGGRQYVAALFPDNVTFAIPPGAIPGVPSRQAKPGDIIVIYGVGFGPVTPDTPAGQIVQQQTDLVSPLQIFFGQTPATLKYQGLAPQQVGLYQFNVVVPNVGSNDATPLSFTLGGVSGTQQLYIAVQD